MDAMVRKTSASLAYGEIVWVRRPDAGVKFNGSQRCPRAMVSQKAGSSGRSRISRKPVAWGRPACCPLNLYARGQQIYLQHACETAGAARTRPSPRPLIFGGQTKCTTSGASRRENKKSYPSARRPLVRGDPYAAAETIWQNDRWLSFSNRYLCYQGRDNELMERVYSSLRRPRGLAEHSCRRRKAARGAVGDLHLIFPWQAEGAGDHVLHEGIRAIHRAAFHRDITAMPELIDVVLDAPVDPRLAHQVRADFGGDDFVDSAGGAVGDDGAVEIHDHAFAHRIERSVGPAHADIGGHHQILERIGLIGEAPAFADRRGVTGGADHDLGTLVGAFARHLREHAVMADDQRELGPLRPLDHGNADIAGLPRFDRNPGVEFSIIEFDLAGVVDDKAGIVGIAVRVELHDGEAAPDFVVHSGALDGGDRG